MKVSELKTGDKLPLGTVIHVASSPQPDRVTVEVLLDDTNEIKFFSLFKGAEVDEQKLHVDREAILSEFTEKLRTRLEYGATNYGEFWQGNDTLSNIEEELLDALFYLWVHRRLAKSEPKLFDFEIGQKVRVRNRGIGTIVEVLPRNVAGQLGYSVLFGDLNYYTAIKSELSSVPK